MKNLKVFETHADYEEYLNNNSNIDKILVCKEHNMVFYPNSSYKCNLDYDEEDYEYYLENEDKKLETVSFGTSLWAKVNLGSTFETDNDVYFTFGNNEGYESIFGIDRHSDYEEVVGSGDTSVSYTDTAKFNAIKEMLTEISFNQYYFNNDITNISSFSDAAQKRIGENVTQIPSLSNVQELLDNSSRVWATIGGVEGVKFINKVSNDKYIFIPAAGYCEWQDVVEGQEDNVKSAYIWLKELSTNTYQQEKWVLNADRTLYTRTNVTRRYGKCLRCRQNGNSVDCDIVEMKQFHGLPLRWIIDKYQLSGISGNSFTIREYEDGEFVDNSYTVAATSGGKNVSYNVTDGSTTKTFKVYDSYTFTLSKNGVGVATYKIEKTSGPSTSGTVNVSDFNFTFALSRKPISSGEAQTISNYYVTIEGVYNFNSSGNSNFYYFKNNVKSGRYTYISGVMQGCIPYMEIDYLAGKLSFS